MIKSKKILVSVAGALLAGLCGSIPLERFRGYDPALVATLYGLIYGLAGFLVVYPWTKKIQSNALRKDLTSMGARVELVRADDGAAEHQTTTTNDDHPLPRTNKRRLQNMICGVLAVAAAIYTLYMVVPAYRAFSEDFLERRVWKAAGFNDPEVRRRAYDACMADFESRPPTSPFPQEELAQRESLCSRPMWNPETPAPYWWEVPIAFIKSAPITVVYVAVAVIVSPWLFAFLIVRLLPTGVARLWRWLRTPDGTS